MADPSPAVFHAAGSPALEQNARRERMGQYLEIGPAHGRTQVRVGGAAANAVGDRHVHATEALLAVAVDVRRPRVPRLVRVVEPRRMQRIGQAAVTGLKLAAAAAVLVAAFGALLGPFEIRQHVGVGPAGGALPGPTIEVMRISANIRSEEHTSE